MNKIFFLSVLTGLSLTSCKTNKVVSSATQSSILMDGTVFASLWQSRAAEYHALCIQAYHSARLSLDAQLANPMDQRPKAIITDIDETVLNNSAEDLAAALSGKGYNLKDWQEWTSKAKADTIYGALNFFTYAASKGVEVFYVTNRELAEKEGTMQNLKKFGFPFVDEQHLILKNSGSSKEERRQAIQKKYDVLMYCGDNMGDFSALFDHKSESERLDNLKKTYDLYGTKFIVLPNPSYGDWLGAMRDYNYHLQPQQVDSLFRAKAKEGSF